MGVKPICGIPACDYPTSGGWALCGNHARRLAADLAAIPVLALELDVTLARQSRRTGHSGARSATAPFPFDLAASAAYEALKAILAGWVRCLAEDTDQEWPDDTVTGCADWLLARVHVLRVHPAAAEIAGEIHVATNTARRVIDLAPERHYAGPCDECRAPMYAKDGARSVWCTAIGCRTTYDVAERRALMLDAARDQLLSIPEMIRALPGLVGHELNAGTLQKWHQRGRMLPHGLTSAGKQTFRVGDVLDLLEDRRTA